MRSSGTDKDKYPPNPERGGSDSLYVLEQSIASGQCKRKPPQCLSFPSSFRRDRSRLVIVWELQCCDTTRRKRYRTIRITGNKRKEVKRVTSHHLLCEVRSLNAAPIKIEPGTPSSEHRLLGDTKFTSGTHSVGKADMKPFKTNYRAPLALEGIFRLLTKRHIERAGDPIPW